jgi:hypothetical protein
MTNDRRFFNQGRIGVPLYEGKMMHQFDTEYGEPRFWVSPADLRAPYYRIAIRAIAANTNERTLIAAMLPPNVGTGNSLITVKDDLATADTFYVLAMLNSFVLDFVLRMKITNNVNMFYLYQLPVPRLTAGNPFFDAIVPRAARLTCTTAAFADLWREVMGAPWDAGQAATDPADEIDALVAHLYGLTRDEFAHILAAFPLVFPDDAAGKQKKAALLATYDRMR